MTAYERFGRGRHEAQLNFGDCLAYAVAKLAGEPLLCTGKGLHEDGLCDVSRTLTPGVGGPAFLGAFPERTGMETDNGNGQRKRTTDR